MARRSSRSLRKGSQNRYRTARESRSRRRESIGALFREAGRIAKQKSNMRLGRRGGMMARAAVAGSDAGYDMGFRPLNLWQRCWSYAKAALLIPIMAITMMTVGQALGDDAFMYAFWRSKELLFFGTGIVLMLGWFWSRLFAEQFLYFYVLGHELTHALFVYLSGGRVSDMKVSIEGGYILTNKSNLLIALSPYFIPFWSLVVLSMSGFITHFAGPLPYGRDILLIILGGSWCFHVVWTLWMIPREQPDLQEHGTVFSISIIALANTLLLTAMACVISPKLEFLDFGYRWVNNARDLLGLLNQWW